MADMQNGLPDAGAEDIKQHLDGHGRIHAIFSRGIDNQTKESKLIRDPFAGWLTTYQKHGRKSSLI